MAEKNRYNLMPYNRPPEDTSHNETFEAAEGILTIVGETEDIPVSGYRNFYIDHKQNGRDWLGFTLATDSDLYREIKEETKIRYRGVDYLVKKISDGHLECEIDLDFLKKTFHETYSSEITLSLLLYRLLPSGWTVNGAVLIHGSPLIELEACTNLDILTAAEEEYRCWFSWNHAEKTCTVTSADAVIKTGEYVTDELNLRTLSFRGSSVNFCTRLYAYGKGGVSIDSVNGGKKYIEDYTYSSKLIVGTFKCDYELPANILAAARYEMAIRSAPERSYECDVLDLAKLSPDYDFLDFAVHRTVTLIDSRRGIKVDHRIVEYMEYPDEPQRNTVTLARAVRKMANIKEVIKNSVDEVKVQVAEVNAAMTQNVTEIQANINAVSANVASVNANVGTVVNDIATLNTKTASLNSRVNSVETAHVSLTQTVSSQGATINGITTWQATTYVNDRQETANSLAAINVTATSQGAAISALASWKDTTYVSDRQVVNEALAAINATANAQGASISSLTTWKSTTYVNDKTVIEEAIAAINQTATSQGASISLLTEWKSETVNTIAAINQTANSQGARIQSLTEWKTSTTSVLAEVCQTASEYGAWIESTTAWKTSTTSAIAMLCQVATSQSTWITGFLEWQTETVNAMTWMDSQINNHATYIEEFMTWKTSTVDALVSIKSSINDHGIWINETNSWKTSTTNAIVSATQSISDQGVYITELTTWKTSAADTLAGVVRTANDALNAVGFVVQTTVNGYKLKGDIVIGAINDEVVAQIEANRINFVGFTTFVRPSDLEGGGSVTTINGGLITTETIDVGSIKKSTMTNGSRAVVFDVGIQTSYVRTNDITATGQLNIGGTLVAVQNALTVNGKNVLVEGDVDLTGYATQTWSNNAFAVKDHTHSGYLNFGSANTDTLVVSKVGSSDHYNIALVGHGHSNYALSTHGHSNYAASDHSHIGYLCFKSTAGTTLNVAKIGTTVTYYDVALANHTHTGYAASDHTHSGMFSFSSTTGASLTMARAGSTTTYTVALANHTHTGYAASDHSHTDYFKFNSTLGTSLNMAKIGTVTTYYNIALANHTHTGYISASDLSGFIVYSSISGTTFQVTSNGSTTKINVALANHTHSGYAESDHTHTGMFSFSATAGSNLTMARAGSTTTYVVALANHTHSGYISSSDVSGHLVYSSISGTTLVTTSAGSTTKINIALANHTHESVDTTDHMKFKSTTGANVTLTRLGATINTDYTFALANHTHDVDNTDHMLFGSTTGANITLKKIGAYSNTNYTFSLANHTHTGLEVNYANLLQIVNTNATSGVVNAKYITYNAYGTSSTTSLSLALWSSGSGTSANTTDFMKFKSTTGANITLTKKGSVSDTDYTFSLANHTHSAYLSNADLNGKWYVTINGTKYYLKSP